MKTLTAAAAALLLGISAPLPADAGKPGRVVVLGFDGVDSQIVEQMLAARRLPNLPAVKARGGYSPLIPTIPAQTPVSWATFSTGLDPGGHEIFDFLKRDPSGLVPTFAGAEETSEPLFFGRASPAVAAAAAALVFFAAAAAVFLIGRRRAGVPVVLALGGLAAGAGVFAAVKAWVPSVRPGVRNNRLGKTFWSEEGGRPATVIRMPVTFPPESFPAGRLLSGLGVPDLSGRIGRPTYYASDPFFTAREGNEFSVDVVRLASNTGRQVTRIAGPPGRAFGREGTIDTPLALTVAPSRDRLTVEAGGEKRRPPPGQGGELVSLAIPGYPLIALHGEAPVCLDGGSPEGARSL